ncbi:hypothetical protein LMG9964_06551 [Paraburkholderia phenoliruptrix]|uniref:Uncharacterized protein n=1 Tax=Paraburkholderia phenoliruptrix TaxID=252970 RepID=A0A6J5KG46_9BURK|nr:hypothetical protein LMG9964_06551 [Paraburkholderia phenoliruptrix]
MPAGPSNALCATTRRATCTLSRYPCRARSIFDLRSLCLLPIGTPARNASTDRPRMYCNSSASRSTRRLRASAACTSSDASPCRMTMQRPCSPSVKARANKPTTISSRPRPRRRTCSRCSKESRDTGPSLSTICKHRCRRVAPLGPECRHARTSSSASSRQAPDSAPGTISALMSCCYARDRPQAEDAFRK